VQEVVINSCLFSHPVLVISVVYFSSIGENYQLNSLLSRFWACGEQVAQNINCCTIGSDRRFIMLDGVILRNWYISDIFFCLSSRSRSKVYRFDVFQDNLIDCLPVIVIAASFIIIIIIYIKYWTIAIIHLVRLSCIVLTRAWVKSFSWNYFWDIG